MAYTKETLVDQVYLAITGGRLVPDVKVEREDIEALLCPALNFAITQWNKEERRFRYENIRLFGSPGSSGKSTKSFLRLSR